MEQSRRKFLKQMGLLSALPVFGNASKFMLPKASIKIGYSTITWGDNIEQALRDISSLGFKGVQLKNPFAKYGQNPEVLKKMIEETKLEVVMLSSGNANVNTGNDEAEIAKHVVNAKFIKAVGGNRIQLTNSSRPKNGEVKEEDMVKYGKMLTEIGKRTADVGVETTYHNHMGQLGQTPEEVDTILQYADPKYVGVLLDVAHYQQGGGDPVTAIHKYKDRLKALHIKDVKDVAGERGYQFVELGEGRVNFPAIFDALNKVGFRGYTIVELDSVPVKGRTPLESGVMAKNYITKELKYKLG